ncbi:MULTISPECIES: methyltransferase domain-containing protein [unclassified Moraxella]|uniref:class I SAM-dependent methyltransferase n=1 Tax=unclassified Moraxella TaxID=2685852 RepID=UPI003AF76A64
MTSHHQLNQQQYGDKANNYLTSQVHAQGQEFGKMQALAQQYNWQNLLDLGCGGGHVSYHLAPYVKQVTAYDLTPQMVALVEQQAKEKGLTNVQGVVGVAEQLPFANQTFDAIVTRFSAHHWHNLNQALLEMHRVLTDDGKVIIVDVLGHAHPVINNFLQTIETLRDPSHVRDYHLAEWGYAVELAGFRIEQIQKQRLPLAFDSWVTRMATPSEAVASILTLQKSVSDTVKQYYQLADDGSFTTDVIYLVLSKLP